MFDARMLLARERGVNQPDVSAVDFRTDRRSAGKSLLATALGGRAMHWRAETIVPGLKYAIGFRLDRYGSNSMNPTRPDEWPLKKMRLGLVGSISMRRTSNSASESGNSSHVSVRGSKRAIMSTWCSLDQM